MSTKSSSSKSTPSKEALGSNDEWEELPAEPLPSNTPSRLSITMAKLRECLDEIEPPTEEVNWSIFDKTSEDFSKEPWTPNPFWLDDLDHEGFEGELYKGPFEFPPSISDSETDSDSDTEPIVVSKTFAFRHPDLSHEPTDDGSNPYLNSLGFLTIKLTKDEIAKPLARKIMRRQVFLDYYRDIRGFRELKGSYLRCPAGGNHLCDKYKRRVQHDSFQVCPVPHEPGPLYIPYRCNHAQPQSWDAPTWRRPPHLIIKRRRTGPIWRRHNFPPLRECVRCQHYTFRHHGNTEMHYCDYVDKVQYQGKNPDALSPFEQLKYFDKRLASGHKKRRTRKYLPPVNIDLPAGPNIRMTAATANRCAAVQKEKEKRNQQQKKKPKVAGVEDSFKHVRSRVDSAAPESFATTKGPQSNTKIGRKAFK